MNWSQHWSQHSVFTHGSGKHSHFGHIVNGLSPCTDSVEYHATFAWISPHQTLSSSAPCHYFLELQVNSSSCHVAETMDRCRENPSSKGRRGRRMIVATIVFLQKSCVAHTADSVTIVASCGCHRDRELFTKPKYWPRKQIHIFDDLHRHCSC